MAEEAAGPSATRLTLHQILEDEDLSSKFRDFLGVLRCGENLSFWLEVELFRGACTETKRTALVACLTPSDSNGEPGQD